MQRHLPKLPGGATSVESFATTGCGLMRLLLEDNQGQVRIRASSRKVGASGPDLDMMELRGL